ncbi:MULTISPECIES: hypothetical protein [Rhodococcus]|uniref:hypothetical protein n=1 Tax=Rhodococcus TaxID=1827 RepID=UPI000A3F9637|nr:MULTISPECIES: hypothetical protein [Rhodococcus]MDV8068775.1 hypothetical protein [Rhodococcus sp. IEGM 1366]NMD61272.1 hypothetical protein [Nocardia globerula]QXW05824.1 hypothetical protein KYT97_28985 [Rhodococcus globerulus]
MRTSATLAAYAGGLVVVFGAAFGVGAAVGNPVESPSHAPASSTSNTPAPHEEGHR